MWAMEKLRFSASSITSVPWTKRWLETTVKRIWRTHSLIFIQSPITSSENLWTLSQTIKDTDMKKASARMLTTLFSKWKSMCYWGIWLSFTRSAQTNQKKIDLQWSRCFFIRTLEYAMTLKSNSKQSSLSHSWNFPIQRTSSWLIKLRSTRMIWRFHRNQMNKTKTTTKAWTINLVLIDL